MVAEASGSPRPGWQPSRDGIGQKIGRRGFLAMLLALGLGGALRRPGSRPSLRGGWILREDDS